MPKILFLSVVQLGYELLLIGLLWHWLLAWNSADPFGLLACKAGQKCQWHPQSPRDCPACQLLHRQSAVHPSKLVEPWPRQKGKRGRPKLVETEGYCCNNSAYVYYNITDGRLHALVGNGKHYGADTRVGYFLHPTEGTTGAVVCNSRCDAQ